jgi:hypothetical protein
MKRKNDTNQGFGIIEFVILDDLPVCPSTEFPDLNPQE